jgi:hypothetical protein
MRNFKNYATTKLQLIREFYVDSFD